MSLATKANDTIHQAVGSLESVQGAGFKIVVAFADKIPGLPRVVASAADRANDAVVSGYFGAAQRTVDAQRHAAEQFATVIHAFISPRGSADDEGSLHAV
jgi:hypothetical protein